MANIYRPSFEEGERPPILNRGDYFDGEQGEA
jgi:hypothetical protein